MFLAFICVLICDWVSISYLFSHLFNRPTSFLLQAKCTTLAKLHKKLVWSLISAKRSISDVLILCWSNVYYIYYMFGTQMEVATSLHFRSCSHLAKNFSWFQPFIATFLEPLFLHFLHGSLQSKWAYKLKKINAVLSKWFLVKTNRDKNVKTQIKWKSI